MKFSCKIVDDFFPVLVMSCLFLMGIYKGGKVIYL